MPRNRQGIPREQRVNELVATASELFLTRGYAKTRMSDIADAVGVANAALYWYFPTKEDLLAETWQRLLSSEIERLETDPAPDPFDRLLQGFADLRPYRHLHMTMHELLPDSDVVAAAHDRLIAWVRGLVEEGLAYHGYENGGREEVVELVVVLFEGLNVPGVRARTANEVVRFLLDTLLEVRDTGNPSGRQGDARQTRIQPPST